MQIVFLH
ncbi:Protein of unknown function [Escherichia coli]|nr:Protein of unknown function [Escherichia coli]CDU37635.1 Protein of unknown function [Escherichia coli]